MFQISADLPPPRNIEFVERKGRGHPDSIADALAELVSYEYSQFCLENFGAVLHHYVDKFTLLGGEAIARPGRYRQVRPIRVLLNGRFSRTFGGADVPVLDLARKAVGAYLPTILPGISAQHWKLVDNTNTATGSSSKGWQWWAPRDLRDLPDALFPQANDTSVSVASSPYTPLEAAVLEAEESVFQKFGQAGRCGTDVKVMASRLHGDVEVTACVPVLAGAVASRAQYDLIKQQVAETILGVFESIAAADQVRVAVNTRDDVAEGDIYLLGLGTALEHGDEGVVGRGNRSNGLIATEHPMSLDAPWGKNPVYFSGRVYDSCARMVSRELSASMGMPNSVYLASQNGRALSEPWQAFVRIPEERADEAGSVVESAQESFAEGLRPAEHFAEMRQRYPHLSA